jgi:hypothetical protein
MNRLLKDRRLDSLALLIEAVELFGQRNCLCPVVRCQQLRRDPRVSNASAGIQTRAEHEGGVVDRLDLLDAGDFG